jgi:predicted RNA binding protein YcfA (HicA-like mRNA interferase family)
MSKLTIIPPDKMIAILINLGFKEIRQKGSHRFFQHQDGRTTVIPFHKGDDLGRGLIREILKDIELSVEDYEEIRKKV